MKEDG